MVWSHRAGSAAALLLGLSFVAGCKGEVERFPPPQPFEFEGVVGGGGGSGGGSTASSGGSTTTSATPGNTCECAHAYTFDGPCGTCVNDSANSACKPELLNCQIDGVCAGLVNCPSFCVGKPEAERIACIQACFVPYPDDAAHQLFTAYSTCVCAQCAGECSVAEPITCE